MSETLAQWASGWLHRLTTNGGAHGPGSRRTIHATSEDSWRQVFDAAGEAEALADIRRSVGSAGEPYDRRTAVTSERSHHGVPALWIEAFDHRGGQVVAHVQLVQPYKKRMFGRTQPVGGVVDVSPAGPVAG